MLDVLKKSTHCLMNIIIIYCLWDTLVGDSSFNTLTSPWCGPFNYLTKKYLPSCVLIN